MRGMSLIELLIVIVIVSILASIAYPNYRDFVARATRNEAKAALLKAATNQERFYLQNNQFSGDLNQLGFSASPFTTDTGAYDISVAAPDPASNFTVTATYKRTDAEANKCGIFTIDGRGEKTSSPATDCWIRTR
jgi:type IV pilus assembly protein PilE